MYCDYPLVHAEERLARAAVLDAARIQLSPQQAFAKFEASEAPDRVWIAMLDGRPAYRFGFQDAQVIVYADNGEMLDSVSREMGLRIAAAWTGRTWSLASVVRKANNLCSPDSFARTPPLRTQREPGRHFAAVLILAVAGRGHEAAKARLEPGAPIGAGGVAHIGDGAAGNVGRRR